MNKIEISQDIFPTDKIDFEHDLSLCISSIQIRELLHLISRNYSSYAFRYDENLSETYANRVAIRYFETGDKEVALREVLPKTTNYEQRETLLNIIQEDKSLIAIRDAIHLSLHQRHPNRAGVDIMSSVMERIADEIVQAGASHDTSRPIDAIKGIPVICSYVPLSEKLQNPLDVKTSYWGSRSHSTTIKPTEEFLTFLEIVNISSDDWKNAVETMHDIDFNEEPDEFAMEYEVERHLAWRDVYFEADRNRPQLVDVEDLVCSIDNCPFGFTPLIAFSMPIEDVIHRDWSEPISLTGGILGLHDFTKGSGDPLRFECELTLSPSLSNMMVASSGENDIVSVHGFVTKNFTSLIQDARNSHGIKM